MVLDDQVLAVSLYPSSDLNRGGNELVYDSVTLSTTVTGGTRSCIESDEVSNEL